LGGPIVKDKAFFFFDYEGQRESGAQAGLSCVPDPALVAQTIASLGSAVSQPMLNLLARNPWPVPNISGASTSTGDSNCLAGSRHFGNLGRNTLVGPSFTEFNFSVFKNTAITERVNLQLRAECFNLFNHPNFANPELPNFIADPGVNGIASNGRGQGYYALTATGDVGIGNPFLGGGGPRGLQFAAKITF